MHRTSRRNPALFKYSWAWFLGGLLLFGISAEVMLGSGARNPWGAVGGTLSMIVGGIVANRRARRSATLPPRADTGDEVA